MTLIPKRSDDEGRGVSLRSKVPETKKRFTFKGFHQNLHVGRNAPITYQVLV